MDTQAIAARLTARIYGVHNPSCGEGDDCVCESVQRLAEAIASDMSAHVETLTQQVAELTALEKQDDADWAVHVAQVKRAEQAEQQRDAAHAALRKCRKYFGILSQRYNDAHQFTFSAECDGLVIEIDAALAASAPQKRLVGCERADGTLNIHAESETCEICAPAQETERCR